jgi:Flp pilus assembly protein TadG
VIGRHADERGQALVEFAFVLGLFDLGRGVYTYNTVAQAARQANRLAIVDQDPDRIRAQAIASAPSIALTASNVDVCFKTETSTQQDCSTATDACSATALEIGCQAIVTVHVSYAPFTPIVSLIFSSFDLSSTSVGSVEYVCPTATQTSCP